MRFRFSGHESFPCRYTWLPKAYNALVEDPEIFSDDNSAMVRLGVGKNMVKAIKFWVQTFGVATAAPNRGGLELTSFGHAIFGPEGLDPFLEDIQTLWLLHWKLSSIKEEPLFAWYFLLNQWSDPSFSRSEVLKNFTKESERLERPLSDFTKEQHFDIFLHSYVPVRSKKNIEVLEDSLDCPLNELQFIVPAGERIVDEVNRREPVYEFNQENSRNISALVFVYCLYDYWQNYRPTELTISFRDVSALPSSVGQIFKINESDLRARLETLETYSEGLFEYIASVSVPRVVKNKQFDESTEQTLLQNIYGVNAGLA
jgi:hypothetical protein